MNSILIVSHLVLLIASFWGVFKGEDALLTELSKAGIIIISLNVFRLLSKRSQAEKKKPCKVIKLTYIETTPEEAKIIPISKIDKVM